MEYGKAIRAGCRRVATDLDGRFHLVWSEGHEAMVQWMMGSESSDCFPGIGVLSVGRWSSELFHKSVGYFLLVGKAGASKSNRLIWVSPSSFAREAEYSPPHLPDVFLVGEGLHLLTPDSF